MINVCYCEQKNCLPKSNVSFFSLYKINIAPLLLAYVIVRKSSLITMCESVSLNWNWYIYPHITHMMLFNAFNTTVSFIWNSFRFIWGFCTIFFFMEYAHTSANQIKMRSPMCVHYIAHSMTKVRRCPNCQWLISVLPT